MDPVSSHLSDPAELAHSDFTLELGKPAKHDCTPEFICANWNHEPSECQKCGRFSCKNCLLVDVSATMSIVIFYILSFLMCSS